MQPAFKLFSMFLLVGAVRAQDPVLAGAWPGGLKISKYEAFVHAGSTYASSSTLLAEWAAPADPVSRYVLAAYEKRSEMLVETAGENTRAALENLKAGTEYTIYLRACLDADCTRYLEADPPAEARTEEEYWRIQGEGHSYQTADRVVPDGNVGSYAMRYGPWAGPDLAGKTQFYYSSMLRGEQGVKIGEMEERSGDPVKDVSKFRGVSGFGLLRVCQPVPGAFGSPPVRDPSCGGSSSLATALALFQPIPLTPEAGGKVRLFFEAEGFDGRTRIQFLDSQDGYAGRDFHSGIPTRCETLTDYSAGGGCEPQVVIGVDVDGERGNPNIRNARQFKIVYPALDSAGLWDTAPGAHMWFTTEWPDRQCSEFGFNAAYAFWDGKRWVVSYQENGCPKMLKGAQAPAPVHLGGGRYKMYFNRHAQPGGPTNPQIARKPVQMLYGFSTNSKDGRVEFEDWEDLAEAREVHYLWPDGGLLDEMEESRLDDYMILAPTGDPKTLIFYSNMSAPGPAAFPFIGSAVLVNP